MDVGLLLKIAFAGLVVFLVWQAFRPKWSIRIVVDPQGGIDMQGVAVAKQARVRNFLRDDVRLPGKVTVLATRTSNGRLAIKIQGSMDDGLRQRIRNYLVTTL